MSQKIKFDDFKKRDCAIGYYTNFNCFADNFFGFWLVFKMMVLWTVIILAFKIS